MIRIDARGMSCPQPVLLTKKGLEQNPEGVEVLIDSNVAKGNIMRFAENTGYKVEVLTQEEEFILTIRK